jgi:hypothetical protein
LANPNPSPATRFGGGQANGSRGRQKAARDKISAAFLEALNDTFNEPNDTGGNKGLDALKKVRDEDPATYLRVVASLHRLEIEAHTTPEERLTDAELEMVYQHLLADARGAAAGEPAPVVVAKGSERVN